MLLDRGARLALMAGLAILLASCSSDSPTSVDDDPPPPELNVTLRTEDDADRIRLVSQPDADYPARVNVCLEIRTTSGWWKGLGINREEPTVEGEGNGRVLCTRVEPASLTFHFWKAKLFGVHTRVGTANVNLEKYAGHRVMFIWQQD